MEVLITGMSRSGTTLLEKMISSHPEAEFLSQPFPMLYRHLMRVFYKRHDYKEEYYVFNKFYDERFYTSIDFTRFLQSYTISAKEIDEVFGQMEGWDGQWSDIKDWKSLKDSYEPEKLDKLYIHFLHTFCEKILRTHVLGSKEVMLEEFIPFFLERNIKVLVIVRDPRDVITSLNVGTGTKYSGDHRPTLFHLRNWRKSIAVTHTMLSHSRFMFLRYEDLLEAGKEILDQITDFLEVEPFREGHFDQGIQLKDGVRWKANSSTGQIACLDSTNKNKYRKYLNKETVKYIETFCRPEMLALGYTMDYEDELSLYNPYQFLEPFRIGEVQLDPELSSSTSELALEYKRIQMLEGDDVSDKDIDTFFFSRKNYDILKHRMKQ